MQGIGTEATRATIIGELIERKFLVEEGKKKYLKPTDMAYLLVDSLPDELLYPDETAVWEERLYQMSLGKDSLADFLSAQELFCASSLRQPGTMTERRSQRKGACVLNAAALWYAAMESTAISGAVPTIPNAAIRSASTHRLRRRQATGNLMFVRAARKESLSAAAAHTGRFGPAVRKAAVRPVPT